MAFMLSLISPVEKIEEFSSVGEEEEYESMVMVVCEALQEAGFGFHMEGFGLNPWPVDVSYDLSSVMEQLPDLLGSLRNGEVGGINFYGQGIEADLSFSEDGDFFRIHCDPRVPLAITRQEERIEKGEFLSMAHELSEGFVEAARVVLPTLRVEILAENLPVH
ncbi:hypothetical protein FNQ90_19155 [Streptomyces alkaliphilus]|uniref:Uncharacterized protein n=1 Tax=Streptomyces alkaliphilus TaxID=1472722 RepID=A0A7W3TG58_9ACTN|nr:hypothetical protein [Streptomyces alkaliphilus]MBB0246167.1 hypothetical protein [Streptomyces alkaliphilus]